jgi:DnaJ family protein C protein 7
VYLTVFFSDALRLDSKSADVMALRGLVLFLTARLPDALKHAVSALRLDPDNARAKQLRIRVKDVERLKEEGNTLFKQSKWGEAVECYTRALEVCPLVYLYPPKLIDASQIIGSKPEEGNGGQIRATLLSNRATTRTKLQQYPDALEDITASLELHPGSYKAFRTRARIRLQMEEYEGCVQDFKQSLDMARGGREAMQEVRALQDELRKAETALKRSKTKDYYKILGELGDLCDYLLLRFLC